ncbi:MAG: hypothetical protein JXX29_17170 [Deltaproteobacteria bacterium]|nr:hypothetical protein [Deltaproteobacteria bacterium]MBN2673418.1 hypothetical protein [Deltaproteobacteria bacterium]
MSTKSITYEQKLPTITAIAPEDVKIPTMPMGVYIQEAETLYHWAQKDLPELQKAGLSNTLFEDLPYRSDAASEAQSLWNNVMRGREEAQQRWNEESPEAYDLRDELLHAMRYAYRDDDTLLSRVRAVAEGSGDADMIQDLNNLSIIGRENPAPLKAIGFDVNKIELAAEMSNEMGTLRGEATADKGNDNEIKRIRDQAYTHLKEAVDAIRECGQYVFWRDPHRRKGYASAYLRRSQTKSSAETALTKNAVNQ